MYVYVGFPWCLRWACNAGDLGWEDPLKGRVTHSSILTWKIPWTV